MHSTPRNLLGISGELDRILTEFGFLATHHKNDHPANTGDVSQVLSKETGEQLVSIFSDSISPWFEIRELEGLASIRGDGRSGYRSEGIKDEKFYELTMTMADRAFLITRTGSKIPAIEESIRIGEDGKLFNVVQVDASGRKIRLVYGNHQYGSIPSIETHIHLLANALSIREGYANPATVHAHPYCLVSLGRHRRIHGSFEHFNAAIYTQVEGLNRNYVDLIGVVPYFQSGTAALVGNSLEALVNHRLVLWMNHGFVVREANIRRAYTLLAYAEECARAALFSLESKAIGLPMNEVRDFLLKHNLEKAFAELFDEFGEGVDSEFNDEVSP